MSERDDEAEIVHLIDLRQERFARRVMGMVGAGRAMEAAQEIGDLLERSKRLAARDTGSEQ